MNKEKDYAAKERLYIRGPITALLGSEGLVKNGIVEQTVVFTKRNTVLSTVLVDGARREQKWSYPEETVIEAIVNANMHRDYLLSGTTVELSIFVIPDEKNTPMILNY
jgi:ATP-dependent DNA helicase RecG